MKWSLTFGVWQLLMVGLFGAGITRSVTTQADERGKLGSHPARTGTEFRRRSPANNSISNSVLGKYGKTVRSSSGDRRGNIGKSFRRDVPSPRGYFTSAVLYQTRATFFAAEPDGIKVSQSGSFSFRAGVRQGKALMLTSGPRMRPRSRE